METRFDREQVIQEIYRSLRDSYNPFQFVFKEKNSIILENQDQRIRVSFRINIENKEKKEESI